MQKWEEGEKKFPLSASVTFYSYNGFQDVGLESSWIEFQQNETITFTLI